MPTTKWKMTGSDKIIQEIRKQKTATEDSIAALKAHAQEATRLDRVSVRLAKRNQTAQEAYKAKLLEATKALKGVEGGTKTLKRETTRLTVEYLRSSDANKKLSAQRKKGAKEAAAEQKKAAAAADLLKRKALSIVRENEQPLERFKRKYQELNRLYRKGALGLDQKKRAAAKLRTELKAAGDTGKSAFNGIATSLAGTLAGIVSVSGAIGLARRELEAIKEESERVTQTQLTATAARDVLKKNIAILPRDEREAFLARASKLAADEAIPQRVIDAALAESFSAQGGDTNAAFRTATLSARFNKTDQEAIGPFAGSLGDIAKATKDSDAERNLGFILTVGALSRVTDVRKQAATIPSALAGAATHQTAPEVGGALFGALSGAAADFEGRMTGTAIIRLTEQLAEFSNELIEKGTLSKDVDTFSERLQELRKNPVLAKEFTDKVSLEAKVSGPLKEFLLDKDSLIAKQFRSNKAGFGSRDDQIAKARELLGDLGQGQLARTAEVERSITSNTEQYRLGKDAELSGQAGKELMVLLSEANRRPFTIQQTESYGASGPTFSREEAISEIKTALSTAFLDLNLGDLFPTKDSERAADSLEEILRVLQRDNTTQPPVITTRAE